MGVSLPAVSLLFCLSTVIITCLSVRPSAVCLQCSLLISFAAGFLLVRCLFVCFVLLSVCLTLCPVVYLLVCPSVRLSLYFSVCLFVCPSVCSCLSIYLFMSVCMAVSRYFCLSVCLSVCLCVSVSYFVILVFTHLS